MVNFLPAGYESSDDGSDDDGYYQNDLRPSRQFVADSRPPLEVKKEKLKLLLNHGNLEGIKEELDDPTVIGFDIDCEIVGNWNMLYQACFLGLPDVVEYLVEERGAFVNATKDSETVLMVACLSQADSEKVLQVVKALKEKCENMRSSNSQGVTALMNACRLGHTSVVKYLLSNNDSYDAIDNEGKNALFHAIDGRSLEIAKTLIDAGIDTSVSDRHGVFVKDYARNENQMEIFALFPQEEEKYQTPCDFLVYNKFDDLIPGLGRDSEVPAYFPDIISILRGIGCEKFVTNFAQSGISLEQFLNIDDDGLKKVGLEYSFERNIIKMALLNLHKESWKPSASDFKDPSNTIDLIMMLANIIRHLVVLKCHIVYMKRMGAEYEMSEAYQYWSFRYLKEFQGNVKCLENKMKKVIAGTPTTRPLLITKSKRKGRTIKIVIALALPIIAFSAFKFFRN